ncbi:MAG: response regulator transcription factor [Candidatus Aminicenantes bacterium]|nr:MAG: response regulator transcription factor [Candidatus Aminicenantes bacterium]
MKKILIIEDDQALCQTLETALALENYKVLSASDGGEGYTLATQEKFDLILLDLKLPEMDGFEVCKNLRLKGNRTPIIFLTGEKKEEIDKVLGLELGGDDYMTKPFGTRELLARIKAVLRRTRYEDAELEACSFGNVTIKFKKQVAIKGKEEIPLTAKELGLLKLLITHEGEVVTREIILNEVWGYDKYPTTRTVDTFIHNLRKKIEEDPSQPIHLLTIPWSGYKFQK